MFIQLCLSHTGAIYSIHYGNPISYISLYCKLWFYFHPSMSMMFRWMLAAACLDRYALSSASARLRRFATVIVARRVVIIIVIMWIILPSPFLVLFDLKGGNCMIVYGYSALLYNGIFTIINTYLIPISVMMTSTILIQRNLANKRKRHQIVAQRQTSNEKEYIQRKRDQQALIMLFAQIIIYAIFTTPWTIYSIYNAFALNVTNKSADRIAIEKFISYLVTEIILLCPTSSFYLYTLTSNIFRKELFNMLHSMFNCQSNVTNHRIKTTPVNYVLTRNFNEQSFNI